MFFTYNAGGTLLQKRYVRDSLVIDLVDYLGNIEIRDSNVILYHEDGRIRKVGSSWKYDYYIKDHLGNIRVVFEDIDGNEIITPEDIKGRYDYYSFGMQHAGNGLGYLGSDQKENFGYNGKELAEEMNADLLLYGFRQMDGALGRFLATDLLSHETQNNQLTPYHYAANNPIFYIDPLGLDWYRHDETGKIHWQKGSDKIDGYANIGAQYILEGERDFIIHDQNKVIATIDKSSLSSTEQSNVMNAALATSTLLLADDVTGIGTVDDIAIPIILAGAATYDLTQRTYVTYTLTNPTTNQVYSGRTSGFGDPYKIMLGRYYTHEKRKDGFAFPNLDRSAQGIQSRLAMRGREQQLIDFHGGAMSDRGKSGNLIRGVSKYNPAGYIYHGLSNFYFGNLAPYTGY